MASTPASKPEKSYLSAAVESISPWTTPRSASPKLKVATGSPASSNPPQQQGGDHSVPHRHGISTRKYPKDCPPLNARWFYAVDVPKRKPKLLKENIEKKPLPAPKKFVTFSAHDSKSIEAGYQKLIEDDEDSGRSRELDSEGSESSASGSKGNTSITEAGENEHSGGRVKIPVNEDFLFDVDIEVRELAPVYWLGPIYEVRRGSWFYQEGSGLRPCEENLASQLEEGYLKVKPFRYPKVPDKKTSRPVSMNFEDPKTLAIPPIGDGAGSNEVTPKSSVDNLRKANKKAVEDAETNTKNMPPPAPHQPQTYRLFGTYMNSVVTYQDDTIAWLSSDGIMSRVSSTVYQRFAGGGYLGGVKIIRGYTESGVKATDTKADAVVSPSDKLKNPGLQLDERQQRILKRRSATPGSFPATESSDGDEIGKQPEPESREAALKQQISSMVIDSMDPEAGEEAARRRDEKEIQNDYQDHDDDDQSREIDHLILVTHGIGQRLGMRTESVNFVHDVNVLRKNLKSVYSNSADLQALNSEVDKLPKNCRIQVLPVCWRHLLDFPRQGRQQNRKEHDLGDAFGDDDEYPKLDDITLEGVPFVRSLITDLALDILLYQSAYREHISSIVLRECNRIYKLFLERNSSFDGKVSLIGHSLGSAILFDILCRQKEQTKIHGSAQHQRLFEHRADPRTDSSHKKDSKDLSFDFDVEDFYCLGSPIGLFQMLKGRTIAARHQTNAFPAESPMDLDFMDDPFFAAANTGPKYAAGERISPTTGLPYTISSPKCAQLYNIFHPSDPISYRLEPLIAPAMSSLKPQALPYTKKGIFGSTASQGLTGIGSRVGQSVSGFWSSLSSGIASSLLNRSLGLTGEDIASMGTSGNHQASISKANAPTTGAGSNTLSGNIISPDNVPTLVRENTNEKKRQLAEDTAAADREGKRTAAPTLIDDDIETLYAGFQKSRKQGDVDDIQDQTWTDAEEKSRKLRREELKVRALNQNGRVDFSIQESVLDFNPINTIASHLSYWADEDVSHFMMSQLLSRHRTYRKTSSSDRLNSVGKS